MRLADALLKLNADFVCDHEGRIWDVGYAIEDCEDEGSGDYSISDGYIVADAVGAVRWTAISNRMVVTCSPLVGNVNSPISTWALLALLADDLGEDMNLVSVNLKGEVWYRDEVFDETALLAEPGGRE